MSIITVRYTEQGKWTLVDSVLEDQLVPKFVLVEILGVSNAIRFNHPIMKIPIDKLFSFMGFPLNHYRIELHSTKGVLKFNQDTRKLQDAPVLIDRIITTRGEFDLVNSWVVAVRKYF